MIKGIKVMESFPSDRAKKEFSKYFIMTSEIR